MNWFSKLFRKHRTAQNTLIPTDGQLEPSMDSPESYVKKSQPEKSLGFDELLQQSTYGSDGKSEFAEIYGSALVGRRQNFILAVIAFLVAGFAMFGLIHIASNKTAIPWFVEIDKETGQISKPIRVESVTPNMGVIRSQLAQFTEKCFTIDPKLSPVYQRECARSAIGRAVQQLRDFRAEHEIIQRIAKGNEFRFAKARSVDVTTQGVAFIYLTTTELNDNGVEVDPRNYRIRLDYVLIPPANEDELIANPLGLFVSLFNPSLER